MTLRTVRFAESALWQLRIILHESESSFGNLARQRYERLVAQAFADLLADPARRGVRIIDGRIHYHLRHSRRRVSSGRVAAPRHLIVAKITSDELQVIAFAHDGMVDALAARIRDGELDDSADGSAD